MNKSFPKISIISPSFNQGNFIEEAIKSVLSQDYPFFEHIIIDSCSTDNTVEILKKYPHLKWISEKDKGQSDALNKGFKIATGDIIGWLNTDDFYLPGAFQKVVEAFKEKQADAIYGNFRFINKEGHVTREMVTQNSSKWMSVFYCFIPSTAFFFKRIIIDRGIYIDKEFHISMDKEFFAHIYMAGFYIEKTDDFLAHFRWHGNNKSMPDKRIQSIRREEGIKIFKRYSSLELPSRIFELFVYKLILLYCGFYRTLCRELHIGIYS